MSKNRLALLVAAGLAIDVAIVDAADFTIDLPPLADTILNGEMTELDPALVEALGGDYSFVLGVSIGSAFASENLQLAEAITSAVVVQKGPGTAAVQTVVDVFSSPDLAGVRSFVEALASSRGPQITPN